MSNSVMDGPGPAEAVGVGSGAGGSAGGGPARRRRPSVLTVIGILLLAGGLVCLGWVGYQYLGTNVVSERAFETQRQELRKTWEAGAEAGAAPAEADREAVGPLPGDAVALLRIPAFGSSYEIPILDGTDLDVLDEGVGHYSTTARPGQLGNFAIAGHRVTHGQPFSRLLELGAGDQVVVETGTAIYTYVLDEPPSRLTVKDTDTWVLDPVPGQPDAQPAEALITLTTCQDLFRSPDRSVGFGHLQSTRNK